VVPLATPDEPLAAPPRPTLRDRLTALMNEK
jgi:hypothetical protein